jgi:hypothetical protein
MRLSDFPSHRSVIATWAKVGGAGNKIFSLFKPCADFAIARARELPSCRVFCDIMSTHDI